MPERSLEKSQLEITLVRGFSGQDQKQRRILRALGLSRRHQQVTHADSPTIRGMLVKVGHLISVAEGEKPIATHAD